MWYRVTSSDALLIGFIYTLAENFHEICWQKNAPVLRSILRVADPAGARGNSPAFQRGQTVRALFPARIVDAQRVTIVNTKFGLTISL
jgi:hypothetical protein